MLPDQQVTAGVQRGFVLYGRLLGDALAQKGLILRAVEAAEEDAVPAGQLGDVVEAVALLDAVGQRLPLAGGRQAADHGVHAALQKLRGQDVQQLGGVPGLLQQRQRPGDLDAPVVTAHGLQVADVQGDMQLAGHQQHLLDRVADAAALLPHVDGQGDVLPGYGGQGADQLAGDVEALGGVAQAQGDAQGAVGQGALQGAVQGAVVLVLQVLQLVAGGIGPEDAGAGEHAHMHRQGGQGRKVAGQGVRHQLRRQGAGDGAQIVPDGIAVGGAEGGGAEAAVAVDDGSQALAQLRCAEAGAEQRRVGVAVDVDEAGGDGLAGGVDNAGTVRAPQVADGGNFPAGDGHVRGEAGTARAVNDSAAPEDGIKHGLCLSPVFPPPGAARY